MICDKVYCLEFKEREQKEMMNPIKFVWRNILARKYLWEYYDSCNDKLSDVLKKTIALEERKEIKPDCMEVVRCLKKYGPNFCPYRGSLWMSKRLLLKYPIFWDKQENIYAFYKGKRIYCKFHTLVAILAEQHERSPHRYFSNSLHVEKGDIFVDVGAAEGLISLGLIDEAAKVYLIEENEKQWKPLLEKTFSPYMEKTRIVYKFASDKNDTKNITLDELLREDAETSRIVIKMDVEGAEENVLKGAENLLRRDNVNFVICTYHKDGDEEKFQKFFEKYGYQTEFSDGYMWVPNLSDNPPYLRKGVLRAWKTV